jgi:hypothetical protein
MKPKAGMKSRKDDGGACWKQWYRTRRATLLRLSGEPPKALCVDQLNLTVCCRYAELLLNNARITRYLSRYHLGELRGLQDIVREFDQRCVCSMRSEGRKP